MGFNRKSGGFNVSSDINWKMQLFCFIGITVIFIFHKTFYTYVSANRIYIMLFRVLTQFFVLDLPEFSMTVNAHYIIVFNAH